jgi:hypothetical protein
VRIRPAVGLLVSAALLFAIAAPAAGQGTAPSGILLGGGISFLMDEGSTATGLSVNANKDLRSQGKIAIGLAGDFGWHRFTETDEGVEAKATITSFLVGPRITGTANETFAPFGQVLAGFARVGVSAEFDGEDLGSVSGSGFGFSVGGGLNMKVHERMNFLVQIDFVHANIEIEGENANVNATRFLVGVTARIGG